MEDGDISRDMESVPNGINFAARLQQFEEMQRQHRMHAKLQLQSQFRNNSTSSKVCWTHMQHSTVSCVSPLEGLCLRYLDQVNLIAVVLCMF